MPIGIRSHPLGCQRDAKNFQHSGRKHLLHAGKFLRDGAHERIARALNTSVLICANDRLPG
jgi:hypothetical protein